MICFPNDLSSYYGTSKNCETFDGKEVKVIQPTGGVKKTAEQMFLLTIQRICYPCVQFIITRMHALVFTKEILQQWDIFLLTL